MSSVLYIQASPRDDRSKSIAIADAFLADYKEVNPGDTVRKINLFQADLIPFDGLAVAAKYTILHGKEPSAEEADAWNVVQAVIKEFASADKYILAVPMWNFSIPYRLKQYIDILVQPACTFSYSPEKGYIGLVTGKRAFIAYARGGEYSDSKFQSLDHQKSYLETILGFIGIEDIRSVVAEPMLMAGPQVAAQRLDAAIAAARKLAREF